MEISQSYKQKLEFISDKEYSIIAAKEDVKAINAISERMGSFGSDHSTYFTFRSLDLLTGEEWKNWFVDRLLLGNFNGISAPHYHGKGGVDSGYFLFVNFLNDNYKKRGTKLGQTFLPKFKEGYKLTIPIFIDETVKFDIKRYFWPQSYEEARVDLLQLALMGFEEFYDTNILEEIHLKKGRKISDFDMQKAVFDTKVGLEIIASRI